MEDSVVVHRNDEISRKMQFENCEQFKNLVKMHLSFQLHLNTDELEEPCDEVIYYENGKLKKWDRLSKKMKSSSSAKKNNPSDHNDGQLTMDFIDQLKKLKEFLLREENLNQEGIFRKTGAVSRQNKLRSLMNQRKPFDLNATYSVHDCATVFKSYLADLPEPLLTDGHYPAYCQIADFCKEVKNTVSKKKALHLLNSVQLLVLLLPEENQILLKHIIEMLNTTVKYEKSNKMSADNLGTLFSPHLICPRNLPPEVLHYVSQTMTGVISYMISKGLEIFQIPVKLNTDCRAYYHEMERKKTIPTNQTLKEFISDLAIVNTVFSFVDLDKTAAAHNSDPTMTEISQLYAHVQCLPESAKKRKLIKKFNDGNGQGIPLQVLMMHRAEYSELNCSTRSTRSFSESIKKHIFNKGISFQTPKRSNDNNNFSTPNTTLTNPKLSVLFESPISNIVSPHQPPGSPSTSSALKSNPLQKSVSSASLLTAANIENAPESENIDVDHPEQSNKSFTSKIMKGASLANLKLPFKTFNKSKNVKSKTAASLSVPNISKNTPTTSGKNDAQITEDDCSVGEVDAGRASQNLNISGNVDGTASAPLHFLRSRSISAIAKSTQKMPKAKQESIKIPRSRKPVMLKATAALAEQLNESSNSNELDEDSKTSKPQKDADLIENANENSVKLEPEESDENNELNQTAESDSLTHTFREYLLGRVVPTESPVDSSFSSQPDESGSTMDIQNITETQMSSSLLYFLDGNNHSQNVGDGDHSQNEGDNNNSQNEGDQQQSSFEISNEYPSSGSFDVSR